MDEEEKIRNEFIAACHRWIAATEEGELPIEQILAGAYYLCTKLEKDLAGIQVN